MKSVENARRATIEELVPNITRFSAMNGFSFQLLCKYCRDLGTVSATRHSFKDLKGLRKAAAAFVQQGWWISDIPICPHCYQRKTRRAKT
jgi:hypothetical protein